MTRIVDDDAQLSLSPALHYERQGSRIRGLLNRAIAANGISIVDLEADTGVDEKQIGRALKDGAGAHPPLAVVACILAKDRAGVLITGIAGLVGYEAVPRRPDLAAENRELKAALRDAIAKLQEVADR